LAVSVRTVAACLLLGLHSAGTASLAAVQVLYAISGSICMQISLAAQLISRSLLLVIRPQTQMQVKYPEIVFDMTETGFNRPS
jgi:hypothetical protein